jgi:hypothetical protein
LRDSLVVELNGRGVFAAIRAGVPVGGVSKNGRSFRLASIHVVSTNDRAKPPSKNIGDRATEEPARSDGRGASGKRARRMIIKLKTTTTKVERVIVDAHFSSDSIPPDRRLSVGGCG